MYGLISGRVGIQWIYLYKPMIEPDTYDQVWAEEEYQDGLDYPGKIGLAIRY